MSVVHLETPPIPYDAARFRSTAEFYGRYRQPYPPELIAAVAARIGLEAGDRLLDLGCGPAPLAIGFARLGLDVTGMDPEPSMLAAARAEAEAARVRLELVQGSSYDLSPKLGRFGAVVMGRSFHWMDRAATLRALDALIEPGGAVVLMGDRRLHGTPDWHAVLDRLAERHAPQRYADRRVRRQPDWVPHEAVLIASPFAVVERIGRIQPRERSIEEVVGLAYSRSLTSPAALGDAQPAFERELRDELARIAPDGRFHDVIEMTAVLAFRPTPEG
ncbi:class I SAM-dependent methyltransferase [Ancylobacter defluvii]|uniref:Methyltransferase n=1 Tax=Ancylobacter defluvii TaxID=1282440 RepID=A0A9W6NA58_9HYPH|nr:class I SAM-dependent methyltransferase [Ancylobacter defluvii]MBS7590388.1 class I SAM-dependent methyltransferase [Ancylobacter defluvii]GLK83308.1 methyltransferase [Ancylobacter defluvii]